MDTEPNYEYVNFDGASGDVEVEAIGENQYRILSPDVCIMTEDYRCGDVVEAIRNAEGQLDVQRCITHGNYHTYQFCLAAGWYERDSIKAVLEKIVQQGGQWEGIFGGVLLIALPPTTDYDPTDEITNAFCILPAHDDSRDHAADVQSSSFRAFLSNQLFPDSKLAWYDPRRVLRWFAGTRSNAG